jgi:hypothetical protein
MPHDDWNLAGVGFSLVVSLSVHIPPHAGEKSGLREAHGGGSVCYVHWPFYDGDVPDVSMLNILESTIVQALAQERRVLVHCSAGVNRSALLVALVVRRRLGITGSDAVALVRAARPGTLRNSEFEQYVCGLPRALSA